LDSIARTEDVVKFAKENNQKAVAITDHGSLASFIDQFYECRRQNIKPIMGCEVYEVDDMNNRDFSKDNPEQRFHLVLWARNQEGHDNLLKIVSHAGTVGRYVKPRIDLVAIAENGWGKGIIASTACMVGRFSNFFREKKPNYYIDAETYIHYLWTTFDDAYIELQSHGTEEQIELNKDMFKWCVEYGWLDNLIITSDAHMINEQDRDIHRMFVATGQSREVGETYKDCYMQTDEDVHRIMDEQIGEDNVLLALKNIDKLVDSIEEIDVGLDNTTQMPKINIPAPYNSSAEYLKYLINSGFKEKLHGKPKSVRQKYIDRVKMEFPIIEELGYVDYFIMLYMLMNEAHKREIPLGYARGSGGGCLILYLIGVTQIDSIRWDLDFSRFANLGRKGSMADVDIDMSKRRRKEMIEISEELFGKDNVCAVSTFNTMTMKVALRDVGKVMNEQEDSPYKDAIPYELRDKAAKLMPEIQVIEGSTKREGFIRAIKTNDELVKMYERFPLWFDYSLALDGLPKSRGKNASAIIISPQPILHYASLCLDKESCPIIEQEMHALMDKIALVKMDYLGLKTLDVVDDTLKFSNMTWEDVDINHLNINDKKVFDEVFKTGNTVGIFQCESVEARNMCVQAKASDVEDIVVVNSANRPGTKDQFPDYCDFKLHPEHTKVIHPDLKEIFKQSHSVMMYQEQALALLRYAGFDETETDVGRRAIGKKKIDVMRTLESKFKDGLQKKEWTEEQANAAWDLMVKQSGYSFNRCLTGDTMLDIEGCGKKSLEDIYKTFSCNKYYTLGLSKSNVFTSNRIKNIYKQPVKPIFKITLEDGRCVKASMNHRFLTNNIYYKSVYRLTTNDKLSCYKLINNKYHVAYLKVESIEFCGMQVTYDVEIDSKEHNFFANGICSHNSHAVAYSLLSYLTGYLKTYHPVEFMTACLISSDDNEKTSQYIAEMDRMGIKLSPPDINLSGETYTPNTDNHTVMYGLKNINAFQQNAYDIIVKERPFNNFKEYLEKTVGIMDKTSQIALIKSGAFTNLTKMTKLKQFKYLYQYRYLLGKEKLKPIKKCNKTHIKKLLDDGCITQEQSEDPDLCLEVFNRERKIQGWQDFEKSYLSGDELQWEMETLNTFVSGDPLKGIILPDWNKVLPKAIGYVGGTITSKKENKIKKGKSKGEKMAFLNILTNYGVIDAVCFPKQWKEYRELLYFGNTVVCKITKENENSGTLNSAMSLKDYLIKTNKLQGVIKDNRIVGC
jgi:DNA-directed DNA polymerase III PolC